MYIEPNSTIKIYKGIPLDNTYRNTLYFPNKTMQDEYFHSPTNPKLIKTLTRQSYQRVKRGYMRIEARAEQLYNCNYLAFQNTSFGSKWFYAFINNIEFINNEVSEVEFEIDVMQTYRHDVTLKDCFVEREHTMDDAIGHNIEPEPLDVGEYIFERYKKLGTLDKDNIVSFESMAVIIGVVDVQGSAAQGHSYDGIYGGAKYWAYRSTDSSSITTLLTNYINRPDAVVTMYMCPLALLSDIPATGGKALGDTVARKYLISAKEDYMTASKKFGSYQPKNHKLYTYPYTFMHVDNANGQSLALRYEFFDPQVPTFEITGTINQPVKLVLRPTAYKGSGKYDELSGAHPLYSESLTIECYPVCSWNNDSFTAWIAQNSVPIALNTVSNVAQGALQMGTPNVVKGNSKRKEIGALSDLIGDVTNSLSTLYTQSIKADVLRGNIASGNVNVSNNCQCFWTARAMITEQKARIIDEFFTMFGYATNRVKVPNISGREEFNYVKTVGCNVSGGAPTDDLRLMESIYDNGITFWKDPNHVGDYSVANPIPVT